MKWVRVFVLLFVLSKVLSFQFGLRSPVTVDVKTSVGRIEVFDPVWSLIEVTSAKRRRVLSSLRWATAAAAGENPSAKSQLPYDSGRARPLPLSGSYKHGQVRSLRRP